MEENSMCRVISVANQKGGVAKSTTTLNLGVGLERQGKKVLLIDADPQGSLTASLGYYTSFIRPWTSFVHEFTINYCIIDFVISRAFLKSLNHWSISTK